MFNQILRPIVRNVTRNGTRSSSSKVVDFKLPTLDEATQPQGSWKEYYDARQKVYNTQLIAGLAVLIGTISFVSFSDLIFFNFGPPEEPVEEKK
ncbi:uncharacterized protein LOC112639167 [Camponotus floridanus]|uniref:uncharacterized protein LOC112639167 n=1 Tax=Camponotus floridanus TaxID=104421 RepID=UPI000DC6AFE7|nr:uncharacterized protein LOC112639167 [Camponotus floridanus]